MSQQVGKEHGVKEQTIDFTFEDILENVRPTPLAENNLSDEQKIQKIEGLFLEVMQTLGLDTNNESLKKTPNRVAKMYVNEAFSGLKTDNFPTISVIENDMKYDQMVVVKNISITSTCEHHFVTIDGRASVAYIPNRRVIGLSKLNRIVKYFARRPQVQERLTKQVGDALSYILDTNDVAVFIDAKHYCVVARGVEDIDSTTVTSDLRGAFKNDPKTRSEFMNQCTGHPFS